MKQYFLILSLIILVIFKGFSQTVPKQNIPAEENPESDEVSKTDPIQVRKVIFPSFYQNGERLPAGLIKDVVANNPEALKEMQKARKNYLASVLFNTTGSLFAGYSAANAIFSKDVNWKLVGAGAVLLGVGIPFTRAYLKHAEKAADIHNKSLNRNLKKSEIKVGLTGTGVGINLTF